MKANVTKEAKFKFKCHYCGKIGHKKKNCFKWKRDQQGNNNQQGKKNANLSNTEVSFMVNETCCGVESFRCIKWIVDFGARDHMSDNEKCFNKIHELEKPIVISWCCQLWYFCSSL